MSSINIIEVITSIQLTRVLLEVANILDYTGHIELHITQLEYSVLILLLIVSFIRNKC